VRSSGVGPIPPQTAMREIAGSSIARRIAAMIAAGERPELLVRHAGEAALGVLHHDDGVDAEHVG